MEILKKNTIALPFEKICNIRAAHEEGYIYEADILSFLKGIFIYLKVRVTEVEGEKHTHTNAHIHTQNLPFAGSLPQMGTTAMTGPGQSQEPGIPST